MPPDTLLEYSIDPGKIDYSGNDRRSIVRLTIKAENLTSGPIDVPKITFVLPNDRIDKDSTLTRDPATVTTAPGDDTPWAIFSAGDGYCYAAPLPPAVGVPAGQAVRFVLGNIIVNSMPGIVHIGIIESTDRDRSTTVPVVKDKLAPPGGEPPVIDEFKVDPAEVAQGATTTISWKVRSATRCLLDPGPIELPSPDSGQLSIPVHAITNFTLTALGPAGKASSSKAVSVMPVRIDLFKAVPAASPRRGDRVTLEWATEFASSVSIGPKLGTQPLSGKIDVFPDSTTIYSLTANGFQQKLGEVVVKVGP